MVESREEMTAKTISEFDFVLSMGDKLGEYVHQWIAVVDDKLVAKGRTPKEVYVKARKKHPTRIPFVMKVPADEVVLL